MSENGQIVSLLGTAYMMELETVTNYLANSVHLDGEQAEEIKRALGDDVTEELGHARKLAQRIKQLDGNIPGSLDLDRSQKLLQPPREKTDVRSVVGSSTPSPKRLPTIARSLLQRTAPISSRRIWRSP